MNRRQKGVARRAVIKISLVLIVILAALLYLGTTVPPQQQAAAEEEETVKEITGEVISEIEEDVDEEIEEVTYGISFDYVLSKKDCKCYSVDEDMPKGRLDCRAIFGLVGCSDAGIPIKGHMIDEEGNIKEQYLDDLGLA